jgi:hypothetical protein
MKGPTTPGGKPPGLGSSHFARHYLGNLIRFLFLQVLRCFTSLGLLLLRDDRALPLPGYPIRKSPDQSLLPAPRSVSSVVTSFFASLCQGIHRMPLLSYRNFLVDYTVIYASLFMTRLYRKNIISSF